MGFFDLPGGDIPGATEIPVQVPKLISSKLKLSQPEKYKFPDTMFDTQSLRCSLDSLLTQRNTGFQIIRLTPRASNITWTAC